MVKQYILTGAPGCGKTSIIDALKVNNISVVAEAATDIICERQSQGIVAPWQHAGFIDDIVRLQIQRQKARFRQDSDLCFYDRSPICTYALAVYLDFDFPDILIDEIKRLRRFGIYEKTVFFIDNLGFIENTQARKISFEDALRFEQIHIDSYKKFGYDLIHVPRASVDERVDFIIKFIEA